MRRLLLFTLPLLFSCNSKPSKTDALNFYELIYKATVDTRTGERKLIDEMSTYFDENMKSNDGKVDSLRLQYLLSQNDKIIDDLKAAKQNINSIADFNYEKDLKKETSNILDKQLALHQNGISKILNSYLDGKQTNEEAEEMKNAQKDYENIKSSYKDWKVVRKKFCNDFGITYDDLKVFKDKYNPTEVVAGQE